MTELDETIREFLVESFENLDRLDQELIRLEEDPRNQEPINSVFRIVHTIKGTCGFFEFKTLEAVSHVGENLLDSLRDGTITPSNKVITALLQLGDALRVMLTDIEQTGAEGTKDYVDLRALLTKLNEQDEPADIQQTDPAQIIHLKTVVEEEIASPADQSNHDETQSELLPADDDLESMFQAAQQEYSKKAKPENPVLKENSPQAPQPPATPSGESSAVTLSIQSQPVISPKPVSAEESKKSEVAETALRVDITLLDKLMNLVGELVLARNQILQFTKTQTSGEFVSTSQRLNLITSELQESVMRTRMQPIANVWNKLPRIVRDVAHACGKEVKLEMEGKDTELDKTIIEAIKDPLTHVIRNAVDHGVENPSERVTTGKCPEGTLSMKAFHEGGQVIIEIADDGAGLNVERIKRKALDRGIITPEKAARMTDQEIQRLIFLPGFSTAEKVTNISGRGVGMDVVRSNIERIGGTVDVSSRLHHGTTFTIKIPLTLAIIPALIVKAAGNRYAIPQVNLLELVRIEGEQIQKNLEEIQGSMFYRLRGKLLPLVRLRDELKLDVPDVNGIKAETVLSMVVVRADNLEFGLLVDGIFDTEEIVVKPLGKLLKNVGAFAGATIMGDGRVALILDVVGLARNAQITKGKAASPQDDTQETQENQDKKKMLIFRIGDDQRAAIPLDAVHRLEEFDPSCLERAAGGIVVQYRGGILPLIDLNEAFTGKRPDYHGPVKAFVHRVGDHYVGFVVERIVDIVEQSVKISSPFKRPGLVGSAVLQGVVTDLVDLSAVLDKASIYSPSGTEGLCN